jgi:hypothetical protein
MAKLAPMPRARVRTTVEAKLGDRHNWRAAYRRSCTRRSRRDHLRLSPACSLSNVTFRKARRAADRASSSDMPLATFSADCWSMWNSISSSSCFVATVRRVIVRTLKSNRSIHRRFFIYSHCTTRLLLPVAIRSICHNKFYCCKDHCFGVGERIIRL